MHIYGIHVEIRQAVFDKIIMYYSQRQDKQNYFLKNKAKQLNKRINGADC